MQWFAFCIEIFTVNSILKEESVYIYLFIYEHVSVDLTFPRIASIFCYMWHQWWVLYASCCGWCCLTLHIKSSGKCHIWPSFVPCLAIDYIHKWHKRWLPSILCGCLYATARGIDDYCHLWLWGWLRVRMHDYCCVQGREGVWEWYGALTCNPRLISYWLNKEHLN